MDYPGKLTDKIIKVLVAGAAINQAKGDAEKIQKTAAKTATLDPKKIDRRDFNGIFGDSTMSEADDMLQELCDKLDKVLSEKMDWPDGEGEQKAFAKMVNVAEEFGQQSKEMKKAVEGYAAQLALTLMVLSNIKIGLSASLAGIPQKRKALAGVQKTCQAIDKAANKIVKFPRVGSIDPAVLALTLMQHSEALSGSTDKADRKFAELEKKMGKMISECDERLADNKASTQWIAKHSSWKEGELERKKQR
jgi:ElaB/YqjD/DUF883 family membrane-anchored ribosome-binding protein